MSEEIQQINSAIYNFWITHVIKTTSDQSHKNGFLNVCLIMFLKIMNLYSQIP